VLPGLRYDRIERKKMKRLLLILAIGTLVSCKKSYDMGSSSYPPPPPPPPPPAAPVLLKDIVYLSLPSPYYHFEYDNTGKPIFVSFASDFTRYDIHYTNGAITDMRNNIIVNKDRLQYTYNNAGKVELITYADSLEKVYTTVSLVYNANKLVKLERAKRVPGGFIMDKIVTMSYYADDNLSDITYHTLAVNGAPENSYTLHFENYDNKINVDGFGLIKNEFFDHFFLLPGVQLQKNNPGRESLVGVVDTYTVDFTYTYNDKNLPVSRTGDLKITGGTRAGQRIQTSASYSYY